MVSLMKMNFRTLLVFMTGIAVAGVLAITLLSFYSFHRVKINGATYREIISGKDLVADILPPPEYIIESYLVIITAYNSADTAGLPAYREKLASLKKDYSDRHVYWQKELPEGVLKDMLIEKSYQPATAFYKKAEEVFFPALVSGDRQKAGVALADMNTLYQDHRLKIDEVVKLAAEWSANNEKYALSLVSNLSGLLVAAAVLTIGFVLLFSVLLQKLLMERLGGEPAAIAEVVDRISTGDLRPSHPVSDPKRKGIWLAMGGMRESLSLLISEIRRMSESIASSSRWLGSSAEQISKTAKDQSARVSQIAASSTEMSQTITDIARNSHEISGSATETLRVAQEGSETVEKSIREVCGISDTVTRSSNSIRQLGDRSKQIGDIISVINDIADQTNLLALNAAIEAARAGEQGRGFAVVADEVRKLAERTSKATSEIREMISGMQREVLDAVSSMETVAGQVKVGVDDVNQAGQALRRIVDHVVELQGMVVQIATATEEMSTVAETINQDIESVAHASDATSSEIHGITKASLELAGLSEQFQRAVTQFKV